MVRIRHMTALLLVGALVTPAAQAPPSETVACPGAPNRVAVLVQDADGTPLPDARVRLRNIVSGAELPSQVASRFGEAVFIAVAPGTYIAELVDDGGDLIAVGHPFTIAECEPIVTMVQLPTRCGCAVGAWLPGGPWSAALLAVLAAAVSLGVATGENPADREASPEQ